MPLELESKLDKFSNNLNHMQIKSEYKSIRNKLALENQLNQLFFIAIITTTTISQLLSYYCFTARTTSSSHSPPWHGYDRKVIKPLDL